MSTQAIPKGFPNPGSLCYLNSLLQCLASVQSFSSFVMNSQRSNHDDVVTVALSRVLSTSSDISYHHMLVRALASRFQKQINMFEQNDITEMYALLLDHIARICGKELSQTDVSEIHRILDTYPTTKYYSLKKAIDRHWYMHHKKEYSDICDIAFGQHIGQVECQHCHALHHNIEVFSTHDIHIPIPHPVEISLQELLFAFFKDEALTDWVCDKCHHRGTNTRSLRNWRNPKMLIITVKRFTAEGAKINTRIQAPVQLNVSPITLCKETQLQYKLKAVACHHGSFFMGHYIAIVNRNDSWYITDDDDVRACSIQDAERYAQDGYMFVYEAI